MHYTTRMITYMAMLVALNIILTRFFSVRIPFEGIDGIRLGFGTLPLVVAGILLGPGAGFLVGIIGDLVGFAVQPSGMYLPTFTLAAGLYGLVAGAIAQQPWQRGRIWQVYLAVVLSQSLISLLVTPSLLSLHFGLPFWLTMPGRLLSQTILIPCYCMVIGVLLNRLAWINPYSIRCRDNE